MEINEATQAFIHAHQNDDVRKLALQGCKDPQVNIPLALQQIKGRQKAKEKLPEHYAHDGILYPATLSLEQCSSAATAHYKTSLADGDSLADLSGGFGVDMFAFARHFTQCIYIEPNGELCDITQHNAHVFGLTNIKVLQGTLEEHLANIGMVDWLYVDPSRRDPDGHRVVTLEECSPNLTECLDELRTHTRKGILVKLSPLIDIKHTLKQLPGTHTIHSVAVNGECKEVLFLLDANKTPVQNTTCIAANILRDNIQSFTFTMQEEASAQPRLADAPLPYLYEPNAAILKAGAFKCIATRFNLQKLHPHTHLYSNDTLLSDFPGRVFRIEETIPFGKNARKSVAERTNKANVSVRNFPITAEELKKTLKLKDGGDTYIFGATLSNGDKALLLCRKCIGII
ncbi:MAG: SAM-dependent methyltransferase [Bacteroidales bacterium]|nr:SAM-dependent methyltransferase [Bacteroidales bacterium]